MGERVFMGHILGRSNFMDKYIGKDELMNLPLIVDEVWVGSKKYHWYSCVGFRGWLPETVVCFFYGCCQLNHHVTNHHLGKILSCSKHHVQANPSKYLLQSGGKDYFLWGEKEKRCCLLWEQCFLCWIWRCIFLVLTTSVPGMWQTDTFCCFCLDFGWNIPSR